MASKGKKVVPYSLQHVHCAHCEPCLQKNCIDTPELRRKCPSAMRRDDLKNHTIIHHDGKPLMATEDRQRGLKDFFKSGSLSTADTNKRLSETCIFNPTTNNVNNGSSTGQPNFEQKIDARF